MQISGKNWRRQALLGMTILSLTMALMIGGARTIQADDHGNGKSKKNKSATFTFYKLLDTNETGANEPFTDGNAYWYGEGRFNGSQKVYQLKVTLPFDRKFPGFGAGGQPAMMNITPTEMTYEITGKGREPIVIVFKGWADLKNLTFFLHNGTVSPVAGWTGAYDCPIVAGNLPNPAPSSFAFAHEYNKHSIKMTGVIDPRFWFGTVKNPCDPNGAALNSQGPRLIHGTLFFPDGIKDNHGRGDEHGRGGGHGRRDDD